MIRSSILHLTDYLTTEKIPFAAKTTSSDDNVLHDHSFIEIFYITNGHIKHVLNGVETMLKPGDTFLLTLNDSHIFLRDQNTQCEHRDIIVRLDFFKEICNAISPDFYNFVISKDYNRFINLSANQIKTFEQKINNINKLVLKDRDAAIPAIKFLINDFLGQFYEVKIVQEKNVYPEWMNELLERFQDIELLKGGLKEIMKPFYFTNEHMCRAFKKFTGTTMTDYLNQRRIFEAANMLIYSNKSVSEICYSLGFSSTSYFNKLFKSQYHVTPLKFKKV